MRSNVRHFTSGRFNHVFTLVFADRVRQTEGSCWDARNRAPGGWVADLDSPDLLGVVGHLPIGHFGVTVEAPGVNGARYGQADTLEEAIREVHTVHAELLAEVARREMDPVYALEQELSCHDWWHHMSDDGAVYRGGEAHWRLIQELAQRSPADAVRTLWARYAPEGFGCPV